MACFLRGRFGPGPNPKDCENLLQDSQNKSSVSNLDSNIDVLSLFKKKKKKLSQQFRIEDRKIWKKYSRYKSKSS